MDSWERDLPTVLPLGWLQGQLELVGCVSTLIYILAAVNHLTVNVFSYHRGGLGFLFLFFLKLSMLLISKTLSVRLRDTCHCNYVVPLKCLTSFLMSFVREQS